MTKIVASIEARMGSSRLPGKMLKDVCGQPAIVRLINRLKRCRTIDEIVLATTTAPQDDLLAMVATQNNIAVFRGSEDDVLGRVVGAHQQLQSELVVEVTGDCILLDPELIDMGVTTYLNNNVDVVANVRKLSYPMGMDVQVFSLELLAEVAATVFDPAVREHVSLYFYEHPEKFNIMHFFAPTRWHAPEYRFQLDYVEDLKFINEIYKALLPKYGDQFGLEEIMNLLKQQPELAEINLHCVEKAVR